MSKSEWMEEQKQKKQCQILKKGSKWRVGVTSFSACLELL